MVRSAGLEPATYGLEGRCSIQLSYERLCGTLEGSRTHNPQIRSLMLYPVELRTLYGVSDGIRTHDPQSHNLVL